MQFSGKDTLHHYSISASNAPESTHEETWYKTQMRNVLWSGQEAIFLTSINVKTNESNKQRKFVEMFQIKKKKKK